MTGAAYSADDWIDRLASALRILAKAQEPWLQKYYEETPYVNRPGFAGDSIS